MFHCQYNYCSLSLKGSRVCMSYMLCNTRAIVTHTTCGSTWSTMKTEWYMCSHHVFVHVSALIFSRLYYQMCFFTGSSYITTRAAAHHLHRQPGGRKISPIKTPFRFHLEVVLRAETLQKKKH